MTAPRVTIGVPVYNGEATLAETLDSLLAQEFTNFELLVSDNASTDRTREIAEAYVERDSRVSYVRNESNIGLVPNHNQLVPLASGEYFKWSSASDLVDPRLIGRCVEVLDADPTIVLAYGRTRLIDNSGALIRDHEDGLNLVHDEPWERLRQLAAKRWLCNPIYGVIRAEVLRRTPLHKAYHSSDVTLLAQLAFEGRFVELWDVLFYRRATSSTAMNGWNIRQVEAWMDPRSRAPRLPRKLRVFLDIEHWILGSPTALPVRLRTAGIFAYAWLKRRAAVKWRIRRWLRGGAGRGSSRSQILKS